MHLGTRFHLVAAAFLFLALVTACSADSRPTLGEATKQLVNDGDKLLASAGLRMSATATASERADQDRKTSCSPNEVQRFFRATGDLSTPPKTQSPAAMAGVLKSTLRSMGYDEVMDERDLLDEELAVAVVHNPETRLTFMITVRTEPNPSLMITGKTECYERSG